MPCFNIVFLTLKCSGQQAKDMFLFNSMNWLTDQYHQNFEMRTKHRYPLYQSELLEHISEN